MLILAVLLGVRACGNNQSSKPKESVQKTEWTKQDKKDDHSKGTYKSESQPDIAAVNKTEKEEESQDTNTNPIIEGMKITGYTEEMERILEQDAKTVIEKYRTWLEQNGYTGVTGLAFCDGVQITLSEQKYSVECQLIYEEGQGNGIQPQTALIVLDYYKNRGLYQFHM